MSLAMTKAVRKSRKYLQPMVSGRAPPAAYELGPKVSRYVMGPNQRCHLARQLKLDTRLGRGSN